MQGTQIIGRLRNYSFFATIAMVVSGCFLEEEIEDPQANVEFVNEISGSVGDGPIVGAAMRVLAKDGALIDEFERTIAPAQGFDRIVCHVRSRARYRHRWALAHRWYG